MKDNELRPLREYYHKDNGYNRIVLMNVDYVKRTVTVFYKKTQNIEKKTFDWCKENLILLNEFIN
tara:strand:- start:266 stop:460 length:195 start_codon:yes stop_codon:yes gene_type:complete